MDRKFLLAGEFGAAARLSPKALRLYAEQGLLLPANQDLVTGYRYYAPDQLPRARLIGRLRRLGLPLARIAFLADLTPEAREIELRGWLRARRTELDEQAVLAELVRGSVDDDALTAAVAIRHVPATKVLCRSRQVDTAALPDLNQNAEREIRAHLRASGLSGDGPKIVTFTGLVTPDTERVVEVAVAYQGSVEPVDDLHIRLTPAHREVYLPVPPAYEDFPLIFRAYDAIEAWTDARPDVTCAGHPYEIYPGTGARFDVAYPLSH